MDHNAFNLLLPQNYTDYLLHVETESGRKRTYKRFLNRVQSAATVLGASEGEGGLGIQVDDGELVGILSHNTMDYSVIVYALLSIAVPFSNIPSNASHTDLVNVFRTLPMSRLFVHSDYLKTTTTICNELLEQGDGWLPPKIYVIGGYNTLWFPEFHRMIQHARDTKMKAVSVRAARPNTLAYVTLDLSSLNVIKTTHGELINTLPHPPRAPTASSSSSTIPVILSISPTKYLFRMFLFPRTFVIFPKWSLQAAISAIPQYNITHLPVHERIAADLLRHPQMSSSALKRIKVISGDEVSARAVLPLCGDETKVLVDEDGEAAEMAASTPERPVSKL